MLNVLSIVKLNLKNVYIVCTKCLFHSKGFTNISSFNLQMTLQDCFYHFLTGEENDAQRC